MQLDWPLPERFPPVRSGDALQSSCSPIWIFSPSEISDTRSFSTGHAKRVFLARKVMPTEENRASICQHAHPLRGNAVGENSHGANCRRPKSGTSGSCSHGVNKSRDVGRVSPRAGENNQIRSTIPAGGDTRPTPSARHAHSIRPFPNAPSPPGIRSSARG